ncbi:hypothetical protein D3C83_263490 [compost metagenome]
MKGSVAPRRRKLWLPTVDSPNGWISEIGIAFAIGFTPIVIVPAPALGVLVAKLFSERINPFAVTYDNSP